MARRRWRQQQQKGAPQASTLATSDPAVEAVEGKRDHISFFRVVQVDRQCSALLMSSNIQLYAILELLYGEQVLCHHWPLTRLSLKPFAAA